MGDALAKAPVEVVVELAATGIAAGDMLGLRVGDIIASEKDVKEPLLVYVQGKPKFHATAGQFKGRKAIQVEAVYEEQHIRTDGLPAAGEKKAS